MGISWINLSVKRNGIRMPMGQKFRALGCTHWWDRKIFEMLTHTELGFVWFFLRVEGEFITDHLLKKLPSLQVP